MPLSDNGYEILDRLYFICSFQDLLKDTELNEVILIAELSLLIKQGLVKIVAKVEKIDQPDIQLFESAPQDCHFLITKQGLFEHNSLSD